MRFIPTPQIFSLDILCLALSTLFEYREKEEKEKEREREREREKTEVIERE